MRWLMPFSDRWHYGDTLFIVDPWIWAVLAGGIYVSRKIGSEERGAGRGAMIAMILVAGYIAAMGASGLAARAVVKRTLADRGLEMPTRLMVAPAPVNPFRKWVVMEVGEIYRFGTFDPFGSQGATSGSWTMAT